ncbi:hypothetical protein BDC45DRAFT_565299 [Circinella umbellata]|nr:hypothetical protein BDC45DRAFT_565299 [Circinella umbellata]
MVNALENWQWIQLRSLSISLNSFILFFQPAIARNPLNTPEIASNFLPSKPAQAIREHPYVQNLINKSNYDNGTSAIDIVFQPLFL